MENINNLKKMCKTSEKKEILNNLYGIPYNYKILQWHSYISKNNLTFLGEYVIDCQLLNLSINDILYYLENLKNCWLIRNENDFNNFMEVFKENKIAILDEKMKTLDTQLEKFDSEIRDELRSEIIKTIDMDHEDIRKVIDNILQKKLLSTFSEIFPLLKIFHPKVNKNFYTKKKRNLNNKGVE